MDFPIDRGGARREDESDLDVVRRYHDETRHHLDRYARSLGFMDGASQPDPFRRYEGAPLVPLDPHVRDREFPFDRAFDGPRAEPRPLDATTVSLLFRDALALSAAKHAGTNAWFLRVNPSSGNLHPTEAYLLAPAIDGLSETPALFHYAPKPHALERRRTFTPDEWNRLRGDLPPDTLFVALTSIHWREAWKYGERAYRYCQHDVGHAIAALGLSARLLGRHVSMVTDVRRDDLSRLLGLVTTGDEPEHADLLLALTSRPVAPGEVSTKVLSGTKQPGCPAFEGLPNTLSKAHQPWPIIDAVSEAVSNADPPVDTPPPRGELKPTPSPERPLDARHVIRTRRSAVRFDGRTAITRDTFFRLLRRTLPHANAAMFDPLPWTPRVHLLLFVHRVAKLEPGLYLLWRDEDSGKRLRSAITRTWEWAPVESSGVSLWRLAEADATEAAELSSCRQEIAAESSFAVSMLAEFDPVLDRLGAGAYPQLFWECGAIGQSLYLEAEAAGVRGTGIGCFFDDASHAIAGPDDTRFQALYHFTVGGPLEDARLVTRDPYDGASQPSARGPS